jgi:hypothetical protein
METSVNSAQPWNGLHKGSRNDAPSISRIVVVLTHCLFFLVAGARRHLESPKKSESESQGFVCLVQMPTDRYASDIGHSATELYLLPLLEIQQNAVVVWVDCDYR